MSTARKELQEALCSYTTDTLTYMNTVKEFCEKNSKWMLGRETELEMIMDIKDRADKIDLSIGHFTQSEDKGTAFLEYMKSKVTQVTADSRRAELQQELAAVVKVILGGLEKLDCFLDAVEKLAVTSLHVFMEENQVLKLPKGISPKQVQVVITAARLICPLLLEFKRDASVFFLPKLQNAEVLSYQLDKYIQTTQKICEKLEKSSFSEFCPEMSMKTVVDLDGDLSEDDVQRMLCHINQLDEIRMDQNFRMVFLFQGESCSGFMDEFNNRQPRMLQFLKDLEETAVQLDRMNKGAKISSVAGSSVGAVGGVLSIVGLALIPVTAGVSLALTMTGVGLGITSGVNSAVTTATEIGVNRTQQKKAGEVFQSFMEDVQILQGCLEEVTSQPVTKIEASTIDVVLGVGSVLKKVGTVGTGIDSLVDAVSAVKMLKSEELIASAGKVVAQEGKALRNVPRVASDIPDIGQAAVKGPLALSKSARVGFIAANALFLGMDIFFICKDSISLAKGSETELSQFIRARAALWSSEMDSWQKIHDSLSKGLLTSEKNKAIMEMPFYPEMKKHRETERE
uniref:Apolipoprotein L4 n=1 Tax=Lateolabrax maculatus TaxID=315492 RepID=A0A4P8JIH8_LATMC|nr:apolipoprotein L4 [Lateolabrax maculatus]